jgi:hypothetical protein
LIAANSRDHNAEPLQIEMTGPEDGGVGLTSGLTLGQLRHYLQGGRFVLRFRVHPRRQVQLKGVDAPRNSGGEDMHLLTSDLTGVHGDGIGLPVLMRPEDLDAVGAHQRGV